MRKIKKNHLFFILAGFIVLLSCVPMERVHADGAVSTKGVIRLYEDTAPTSPSGSNEMPGTSVTKPAGKSSLPNTGETKANSIGLSGLLLSSVALVLLFYRIRRREVE